jgi:hypothetical protein
MLVTPVKLTLINCAVVTVEACTCHREKPQKVRTTGRSHMHMYNVDGCTLFIYRTASIMSDGMDEYIAYCLNQS